MSNWHSSKQDPQRHWEHFRPNVKPEVGRREIKTWFEDAEKALVKGLDTMQQRLQERRTKRP